MISDELGALYLVTLSATTAVLRSPEDAEDAANEALTRIWKKWALYDHARGSRHTWAYVIAQRVAYDYWEKHRDRVPRDDFPRTMASDDPERIACNRLAAAEAWGKLRPHEQRQVSLAAQGWPLTEVAEQLSMSVGTVKSRMGRWRIRLAQEYATE